MSLCLIEQLITCYSQKALSDNAIIVHKTRLVNERMFFVIWRIFRYQLGFSSMQDLELKINMKLVNICVPKEQTYVHAIQESEKFQLFKIQIVQNNCIRMRCWKKSCKRSLKLYPTINLRYKQYDFFFQFSRKLKIHNSLYSKYYD